MTGKSTGLVFAEKPSVGVEPTNLPDRSRYGNNGTYSNITDVQLPSGLWVRSLDGASGNVDCGSADNVDNLVALSISIWYNPVDAGESNVGRLVCKIDNNTQASGWEFRHTSTNRMTFFVDFVTTDISVTSENNMITFGVWQHLGLTWDGSPTGTYTFLHNGGINKSDTAVGAGARVSDATKVLLFCNRSIDDSTINGQFGLARVYKYPLTPAQMRAIFQAERSFFGV